MGEERGKEGLIAGDAVAEPEAGSGEKLGNAPDDHEIIVGRHQGYGAHRLYVRGKFYVSLVDHHKDALLLALCDDPLHVFPWDGGRGGIVGIAQDHHIHFPGHMGEEIIDIENKIISFPEMIIFHGAAHQGKFPGIFRIGRSQHQRFLWRALGNEKGDKLGGAVSHNDVGGIRAAVRADGLAKACVGPVWVAADHIQVIAKLLPHRLREPQGIDIGAKADNLFLGNMIIFFNFLQVTSVKFRFFSHKLVSFRAYFEDFALPALP